MKPAGSTLLRTALILSLILAVGSVTPVWATTLQEEIDLGKKLDQQVLKEFPLSTDKQALKEIDTYGQKLIKGPSVKRPQIEYHFRIIQQDDFNAFSTPGGYVYFSERLWDVLRPDERIGVLAHEIVHCDRRHALDAISKAQRRQIWLAVLLTAVNAKQTVSDIADMLHQLYTLKYSRGDERQADEIGIQLVQEAGYNPAGLLLAMRKIQRFQTEQGKEPPKIFSDHPPTPERLAYLEADLKKLGVAIPPEDVKTVENPDKIGQVTSVSGADIDFTSTKGLRSGAVVWLMGTGWDSHYENRTSVPIARAVVTAAGTTYRAHLTFLPGADPKAVVTGTGVYMPLEPKPQPAVGIFAAPSPGTTALKLTMHVPAKKFERLVARQPVWNKENTQLIYDSTSYIVVTDPSNPTGYVAVARPKFSYAPIAPGVAVDKLSDPDARRWAGIVTSIGRRGETLELLPALSREQLSQALKDGKRFEICYPNWDSKQAFKDRLVGKAALSSLDKKIVLQMMQYSPGWDIEGIQTGFDVYEPAEDKKDETRDANSK